MLTTGKRGVQSARADNLAPLGLDNPAGLARVSDSKWESAISFGLVLVLALWRFGRTVVDPDLWGRLRFGLDRLDAGSYIRADQYSYLTAGRTMHDHDWLTANSLGHIYRSFGPDGLVFFKALIAFLVVSLLCWWLARCGLRPVRAAMLMTILVLALSPTFGTLRPQILTTLMFTLTLLIITMFHEGRSRYIWFLPLIFLLWGNLHGGVLVGIAVLGIWGTCYAFSVKGRGRTRPLLATATCVLALALNPLGLDHIFFLARAAMDPRSEITEWLPIQLASPEGAAYVTVVALVLGLFWRERQRFLMPIWVPLIVLLALPFVAVRHLQLLVPGVVVFGGFIFATGRAPAADRPLSFAPLVVLLAVSSVGLASMATATSCLSTDAFHFKYPARAVSAIPPGTMGNAVVPFNWGEYVIWWLGNDILVSIDGRRETAYSTDVLQANLDFVEGQGGWDRLLETAPTDLVLIPTRSRVSQLMQQQAGWSLAYSDDLAQIYLPDGSRLHLEADPSVPIDGDGTCFPSATR